MKRNIFWIGGILAVASLVAPSAKAITASEAFERLDVEALTLIEPAARQQMVRDYLDENKVDTVFNALEGLSWIVPPVSNDYLQVQVSQVTKLTLRVLPSKKGQLVGAIYTVGDSITAPDSQLTFYDAEMNPLKLDKILKQPKLGDFFDFSGVPDSEKKALLKKIPFPTIEYTFSPEGTDLTARLTIERYMGAEDFAKLTLYMRPELLYHWTGSQYRR